MIRAGRLGRSIRTSAFRYTEWRDRQQRVVARELYDHRNDHEQGLLEKVNVADEKAFAEMTDRLGRRLEQLVPHDTWWPR